MKGELTLEQHPLLTDRGSDPILEPTESGREQRSPVRQIDWRQGVGVLLILIGVAAVIGAWIGVSGSILAADQLSYLTSGGLGGLVAISVGVVFLVSYEHARDRRAIEALVNRLQALEEGVAVEFAHLYEAIGQHQRW